ncbi:MAG: hypothetical protein ABIB71_06910 [Candidatus Woesearchaeota archaeon]
MVAVSLNKTVDDIFSGYSKLETPDERKENKVEGGLFFDGFEELMKQYEEGIGLGLVPWNNDFKKIISEVNSVLSPRQINNFLQATIKYENYHNYDWNTGFFITRLIQNSHDAENNKFTLNTKALSKDINGIGYKLKGRGNNVLEIIVDGDAGHGCGYEAENIGKLHIAGNVGDSFGYMAENIKEIYIGGNTGNDCCCCDKNIGQIYIGGDVGGYCSEYARNIKGLYIGGTAGLCCGRGGKNSTFKSSNKETLRLLKKNVPIGEGNKIYSIQPNGKEKRIGRLMEILNYRLW